MNEVYPSPISGPSLCSEAMEEALNLYIDGELNDACQPALFAHLAGCEHCRRTLDAVMAFRRMSRQEHLDVPPRVDEAFFERLAGHKRVNRRVDRAADRRPLWQARAPVSLRGAVMAAALVFITGLLIPIHETEQPVRIYVEGRDERVEFLEPVRYRHEAVYVFYPGLTVEASKAEDRLPSEPL